MVPLGQHQIRFEGPAVGDVEFIEHRLAAFMFPSADGVSGALLNRFRTVGAGIEEVFDFLQIAGSEKRRQVRFIECLTETRTDISLAVRTPAEGREIMMNHQAVHTELDGLSDHRFEDGSPVWIAEATAVGPVRPTFNRPAAEGTVRHPFLSDGRVRTGRGSEEIIRPERIPDAEQPLVRFVVAIMPGHAHLADKPSPGLLNTIDHSFRMRQIFAHADQRHADPPAIRLGIIRQAVELRTEGAGLHDLDSSASHQVDQIQVKRHAPVFDHPVEPERVCHRKTPEFGKQRWKGRRWRDDAGGASFA